MRDATAKDSRRWATRDWPYLVSMAALLVLVVLAFMVGQCLVRPWELLSAMLAWITGGHASVSVAAETVIFRIRGSRILAAMVVGTALAAAGAAY